MADLGRARAPATNGDSGYIIGTRRIYNERIAALHPARQNYIVQSLGMVCGSAVAPKYVKWPKCSNLGQICERLSRWGLAALTLPLQRHTGVCPYFNEERTAGKSQKKVEMYSP